MPFTDAIRFRHTAFSQRGANAAAAWLALAWLCSSTPSLAHPLQAEPVDHAHVYAFDQFYLPQDDDAFVRQGGLLLLAELNCAACHQAPAAWQAWLTPTLAPDLADVGSRYSIDALWRFLRSPSFRKPGTRMPGLFNGAEDEPEILEALVTYLASLRTAATPPPALAGDADRGREIYHRIGCIACHEPGADYKPADLKDDEYLEKPGLGSVPIALADDMTTSTLADFLQHPTVARPSGRMPAMLNDRQEAADVAAYLHLGWKPPQYGERALLQVPPQTVRSGRQAFLQQRCDRCHTRQTALPDEPTPPALPPLTDLPTETLRGCLSSDRQSGIPFFDLNPLQQRALRLALAALRGSPPSTATEWIDHQMSRGNCYACHDYGGKGGPEEPRAFYLRAAAPSGELPPSLDETTLALPPLTCDPKKKPVSPPSTAPLSPRRPCYLPENQSTPD